MAEYLAHSEKGEYPPQTYIEHIQGVCSRAARYASEVKVYASRDTGQMEAILRRSALFHDLGKLSDQNQAVLHEPVGMHLHLPVNHVDAGSAALKEAGSLYAALLVYSHHKGLPDMATEGIRAEDAFLRDEHPNTRRDVDRELSELLRRHRELLREEFDDSESSYLGDWPVFFRMVLSCLADADHTDTAAAYRQTPEKEVLPSLQAEKRLVALDQYVAGLGGSDTRSQLRQEMYRACRDANINSGFSTCDSPVGSGKTTAVMAHLLRQAASRMSRRVFVILPYTNIIQQSVDTYRKALVLPGEDPEEVVAELHCRADFQNSDTRYLTSLWRAPIIVTTAVAFFETLASNHPAALRRFHELPGSVIFVDEAHNALPVKLLPLAWRWMSILAEEWSCYWILASGSLVRYWELNSLRSIEMNRPCIPELVEADLRERLMRYEHNRVSFQWRSTPVSRRDLVRWVQSSPGPRLLILNTVQSAAVIANDLCTAYGRECVEHLSTALTPEDRKRVIRRVANRLNDASDTNWTLVATSCVEAGVDFSFRTGFRELSSLLSLLQAAGRVNRHGAIQNAEMWSFSLQEDSMLKSNPALEDARNVLKGYFEKGINITPELSTQSMNNEIVRNDSCLSEIQQLMSIEAEMQFKEVESRFNIIDSDTVCAVVDEALAKSITYGKGDWRALQRKAISVRRYNIQRWGLKEIAKDVYQWTLGYDLFLGYMSGALQLERIKNDTLIL